MHVFFDSWGGGTSDVLWKWGIDTQMRPLVVNCLFQRCLKWLKRTYCSYHLYLSECAFVAGIEHARTI